MKKYGIILLAIAGLVCANRASAQAYMDKYARKFVLADPSLVQLTLQAPTLTSGAFTLTLPSALPLVTGSLLSSDLLGNLTWVDPSTISISHGATLTGFGTSGSPLDVAVHGIQNQNLRQSVALSVIGNSTNATANVADISGTSDQVLRVNTAGNALAFGQIATGGITDNAVTYGKMQAMTANMLLGSGQLGTSVAEITLGPGLAFTGTTLNTVGASPTGAAAGDLAGSFPAPTIANTSAAGADIIAALTTNGSSITNNTTGSAAKLTTPRLLAGNSFDGSADVPFANKFIVQGTTDAGLTGAQFLGALGTGIVKNTTTTGVLSIATPGTDYTLLSGLTINGALYATAANAITSTGAMGDGQLLIGKTGGVPILATLTPGAGITITNSANSIIIAAAAGTGTVTSFSFTNQSGITGVVTNPTTTPNLALTLGAITPTSVAATGAISGTTFSASSTSSLVGALTLGNDIAAPTAGSIIFNDGTGLNAHTGTLLTANNLTLSRTYTLPDNTGTIALTSDVTGASIAGDVTGTLAASAIASTAAAGNHIISALNLGTSNTLNADPLKHDATLTVTTNQLGVNLAHANNWIAQQTFTLANGFKYVDGNQALNKVLISDATGQASWGSLAAFGITTATGTAPITINGDNLAHSGAITVALANNGISNALFRQSAALSVVGNATNATANVADITGTSDQVLRVNTAGNALAFGTVATNGLTNNAVTYAKMQAMTTNRLLGSGAGTSVAEITLGTGLSYSGTTLNVTGVLSGGLTPSIPVWTSATTLGNSNITDNAGTVTTTDNITMSGAKTLTLGTVSGGGTGSLSFANSSSALLTTLQAGNATSAVIYKLPTANGSGNQVLSTDGNNPAQLSWTSAPNSSNSVQYGLPTANNPTDPQAGQGINPGVYLFDVAYSNSSSLNDAAGARISSTLTNPSGTQTATALTLNASAGSTASNNAKGLVLTSTATSGGTATGATITNTSSGSSGFANGLTISNTAGAGTSTGLSVTSTSTGTVANTGASITATSTGNNTTTGLLITTGNSGFPTAPVPHITLASSQTADSSAIVTTALKEIYHEETGDLYGTSRMRIQNRTGSNGALFQTIPTDGITNLVDFGFKPGSAIQSNIRLEARTGGTAGDYMRSDLNKGAGSNSKEEFQFYFGTTTANAINVFSVGEAATLLELGNFGIGYNAATGAGNQAGNPLEKLDVHSTSATQANILLSNNGTSGSSGNPGKLEFQGIHDGITSFIAGDQASNNFTYTLPLTAPTSGQVLTSAGGNSSQLSWSTVSGSSGVNYNVTSTQNSATIGASNYLYDIAYASSSQNQNALGARIASTNTATFFNRNATGLTIASTATSGGTSTALDVTASGGSTQYAALFHTGYVGIGTSTPSTTLDVFGTGGTVNVRMRSLGDVTGSTQGRIVYAEDGTGYLNTIDFPSTAGYILSSDDLGNLSWIAPGSSSGVNYNTTSAQATASPRSHYLFNVGYNTANGTNGSAAGGVITSSASGLTNTSATGLTLTTTATGSGNAKGLVLATTTSGSGFVADITSAPDGSGFNSAGSDLVISSAASTGNAQSNIIFNTPAPGSSGSTTRTPTETMRISGTSMDLSPYGTSSGNTTELHFKELAANGSNYTGFKAPDNLASSLTYTLPSSSPTAGQVLSSSAAGVLSWINASGGLSLLNTRGAIYATSATTVASTAALTDGQLMIGSSAGNPSAANLTQGSGITITNGNGTISIATNGGTISGGTTNTIPKYASATSLGNSSITDDGTTVTTTENITMSGAKTLKLGTVSSNTALLSLANASSANLTTIQAGNATAAVTYILPTSNGTTGQALTTTAGSPAQLNWTTISGGSTTPAGSNTQVQYNNSGAFGASGNFTFDNTTSALTIASSGDAVTASSTATTDGSYAIKGSVSGTAGATTNNIIGILGLASSTSNNSVSTIAVSAQGNGNTTDGTTNTALQIESGEINIARQGTTAASNGGINKIVEDDATAADVGPSGVVDLPQITGETNGAGTVFDDQALVVHNVYANSKSIILVTILNAEGASAGGEIVSATVESRGAGVFTIRVTRFHHQNNGSSSNWTPRVGFLVINANK